MNVPITPAAKIAPPPVGSHRDPTKPQTILSVGPAPFRITPIASSHKYLKMVVYGPFGVGKTSLVASAVDVDGMGDVIMVNAEAGTMSIDHAEHIVNRNFIDQVRCQDFKTVALVQEFLKNHCIARDNRDIQALKVLQFRTFGHPMDVIDPDYDDLDVWEPIATSDIKEGDFTSTDEDGNLVKLTKSRLRRFRTALVDSLTEIDTFSMYQLLGIKTDMKLDEDMDVAEWAEFRKNNQLMQLLVRAYRDLPMNVLLVLGNQYTQDELKRFHWSPTITGKLSTQVQGFVDLVGFLQNGKPEKEGGPIPRKLWIQPVGQFDAKSRIASFKDAAIMNPTMNKIMKIFKGQTKTLKASENGTPAKKQQAG